MAIDKKLIDQLLPNYKKPEDIIGENGLLKELTKAILERALAVEMTDHLGYEKHDPAGHHRGNTRNGKSQKTLKGDFGELELETPRDRQATFEPKIVAKGQTRWTGFDDKIISMYARGMTTREIQGHLEEMYGIEVSPALISNVTDGVMEEVKQWQGRPLEELYPIVYLDALMVKVRDEGHVQNKAIYVVLGVNLEGQKEVLGLWVAQTEGAKFWQQVLTELQNRGVKDILIACVDGLKGFPEAIEAVYPRTEVQLCIVHLVRAWLNYVPWKQRKPVAADLQLIYRAATVADAEQQLQELEAKWKAYPSVSQVRRRNWARITPFFHYPPDIRKAIYTTNSVESLNRSLRKIIKTRGGFPNEEAALKLLFLALRQAAKKWTMPIHHWREALNHFTILWPERMPALERIASRERRIFLHGWAREGMLPLPSRSHPQKQNRAVYTKELTHPAPLAKNARRGRHPSKEITTGGAGLRRSHTLVMLLLLVVGSAMLAASSRRHNQHGPSPPGVFDYYLLALSWSPEFCHSYAANAQCSGHFGMVVHGLRPQFVDWYPEHCSTQPGLADPSSMTDIMPDPSLVAHEWSTHGTCSGLGAEDYFELVRRAFTSVKVPARLAAPTQMFSMTPQQLKEDFVSANPRLKAEDLAISCGNNYLTGVLVCLSKQLEPTACQSVRDCRANSISIAPVR